MRSLQEQSRGCHPCMEQLARVSRATSHCKCKISSAPSVPPSGCTRRIGRILRTGDPPARARADLCTRARSRSRVTAAPSIESDQGCPRSCSAAEDCFHDQPLRGLHPPPAVGAGATDIRRQRTDERCNPSRAPGALDRCCPTQSHLASHHPSTSRVWTFPCDIF